MTRQHFQTALLAPTMMIAALGLAPPASAQCTGPNGVIHIAIMTDDYPDETTWAITDPDGSLIATGGPYASSGVLYEHDIIVCDSCCYTFTIYDAYGDGICCDYGNGYYEVYYEGALQCTGGEFGSSESCPNLAGCYGGCPVPPAPPDNDDCADAEPIGNVMNHAFDTSFATHDGPMNWMVGPNVWFRYTAPCTGPATFTLCGSVYDTAVAVYDGVSCDPMSPELGGNDDSFCGYQSEVTVNVVEGQEYLVAVGGYEQAAGVGVLTVHCGPIMGACCVDMECIDDTEQQPCLDMGGLWFIDESCTGDTPFACEGCPDEPLYSLPPYRDYMSGWWFGPSDLGLPYLRFDDYAVDAPICAIHIWGLMLHRVGLAYYHCDETPMTFHVTFYADDAGQPGALLAEYTVDAIDVFTGDLFWGGTPLTQLPMFQWTLPLDPCADVSDGWLAIQGVSVTSPDCWFLWGASPEGDQSSWLLDEFGAMVLEDRSLAVCLVGDEAPPCPADVNGDAIVDVLDLLAVLSAWGDTGVPEDINGDGIVDVQDLLALLAAWGPC